MSDLETKCYEEQLCLTLTVPRSRPGINTLMDVPNISSNSRSSSMEDRREDSCDVTIINENGVQNHKQKGLNY